MELNVRVFVQYYKSFILSNFKYPNYKLKTIGTNMLFSKTILLISAKLFTKIAYALKTSNEHSCCLQANLSIPGICKIRLYYKV